MMSGIHPLRVVAKALAIFVILNVAYAAVNPPVGRLTIYNWLVRGRERLPRGGKVARYNLSPEDLNAAFASHVISAARKGPTEYRVIVLGDSATWGPLLSPSESLVGQLNGAHLTFCGKQVRFFNLSYPGTNVLKDFVILSRGRQFQPDLVVWMIAQTSVDIKVPAPVWGNESSEDVSAIFREYGLNRYQKYVVSPPTFWERTLVGQRSRLARLALLQADGLLWNATGLDQMRIPYKPVAKQLVEVPSTVPDPPGAPVLERRANHAFDVLLAAHRMMGPVPVLIVNEPMYLGTTRRAAGSNRAINMRRSYDQYRSLLQDTAAQAGWPFVDVSSAVTPSDFTNSIYHLSAGGEQKVVAAISREMLSLQCP